MIYQMIRVELGADVAISSVDISECTCANADIRFIQ